MLHTAIIAFTLIGIMFLFTKCENGDQNEIMKRELDKDSIPKYVTEQSKDISYAARDKEIALASYREDQPSISSSTKSNKNEVPEKKSVVKETLLPTVVDSVKVKEVKTVQPVDTENVSQPISVVEVPKVNEIEVPEVETPVEVNVSVENAVTPIEVNTTTLQTFKLPTIPIVPEVNITIPTALKSKSMEEFASNSKMQDELNFERRAKDEVLTKNKLLEKQLIEETEAREVAEVKVKEEKLAYKKAIAEAEKMATQLALLKKLAEESELKARAGEEQLVKEKAERIAKEKAEAERIATEKAAAEAKAKEEAEAKIFLEEQLEAQRVAKEKAEAEKAEIAAQLALVKKMAEENELKARAEEERLAKEKAEAERIAAEKAAVEAKAKEEAEVKRLAEEKAAAEKLAQEQAEAQKVAEQKLLKAFSLTKVEFKFNSMELTDESKALLNKTAEVINEYSDFHYNIQGHTDSSGREAYNVKLSGERADTVKEYLMSRGVDGTLLSTKGFGSSKPIASNETKAGKLENRRVVFEIVK
ncbi:OmpA family protein [bacterium]|nr:OmpA family protein [bacterium]MBU1957285.1 OmpA family protein [bacterium]